MALQSGYRFAVSNSDLLAHGCYAMAVEQAMDINERTRVKTPAKDKQTGESVWAVTVIDRDPEAREKQIKVKVLGPYSPELPGEIAPGTGLHAVEFTGLTVTPYVVEGGEGRRARLAYSYRASGMYAQGKAPTGSATQTGRSGGLASGVHTPAPGAHSPASGSGESKAA